MVLLRVGGFGLYIGVDLVLPGLLEGSFISVMNDDGDKTVFLGGCKEFDKFKWLCGILPDASDNDVLFVRCSVVVLLLAAECGEAADQSELFGECRGCTRKCS